MERNDKLDRKNFAALLADVKLRIQAAQTRAVVAVNSEMVHLYWDIGRIIHVCQKREGWGAAVIPRLAAELKNELPDVKGFSERNIGRMIAFYRSYPEPSAILPQAVAKLTTATEKRPQSGELATSTSNLPQTVAQLTDPLLWSVPWAPCCSHGKSPGRFAEATALRTPHRRGDRGGTDGSGEDETGRRPQKERGRGMNFLHEHMKKLDKLIWANLEEIGYGG